MQFKLVEALRHARTKRKEVKESAGPDLSEGFETVDPVLFKYFFDLQGRLEKEGASKGGGMDYHAYAERMWQELIGDINSENTEIFKQFENSLISNLHEIDMNPLVYSHVTESMATLIKKYQKSLTHLSLWTKGDVVPSGYQVSKIESSEIINSYHKALKSEFNNKDEVENILRNKTSYMVADDKLASMMDYAEKIFQMEPDKELKIVVIEDSRENFEKVREGLAESLGDKSKLVQVIPIWVTYSREGQQARKKALTSSSTEDPLAFRQQKIDLNSISSFEDLLDADRFGSIFENAHVFVDFDGVIGDNIAMREEQAKATYNALMQGAIASTKMTEKELVAGIKTKIQNLFK